MKVTTNYLNNTPSFNGLFTLKKQKHINPHIASMVADILHLESKDVFVKTKNFNHKQIDFMQFLTNKYNRMYYRKEKPENPQNVLDIIVGIAEPTDLHIKIADKVSGSFEDLGNIFKLIKDKTELEAVLLLVNQRSKYTEVTSEFITDILQSPYKEQYLKNPNEYRAFLSINRENENAIKDLDKLISEQKYVRREYEKQKRLSLINQSKTIQSAMSYDTLDKYYSKEGADFIESFADKYLVNSDISDQSKDDIVEMYRTTTAQNLDIRRRLMRKYADDVFFVQNPENDIHALCKVFEQIDKDEYAFKFVLKFLERGSREKIDSFAEILSVVPTPKAFIFHKNLFRIIENTQPGQERNEALLKELTNPFFQNKTTKDKDYINKQALKYGFIQKDTRFNRFIIKAENMYNKFRYSMLVKRGVTGTTVVKEVPAKTPSVTEEQIINSIPAKAVEKTPLVETPAEKLIVPEKSAAIEKQETIGIPAVVEKPIDKIEEISSQEKSVIEAIDKIEPNAEASVIKEVQQPDIQLNTTEIEIPLFEKEIATSEEGNSIKLVNTLKKAARQQKKIELQNEVKDFIKKKLHAKTVAKQEDLYTQNATKMRLKLLPEIFDSIKETRSIDRTVGKRKSDSANKNAVDLYNRINGQNRKLIRYMLLKRNVDGTRMFEINDIIAFIDKANKRISKEKSVNPNYKSADAKAYYEHLYQANLDMYGKLTKPKKSKKV